jgi:hypothetical protein
VRLPRCHLARLGRADAEGGRCKHIVVLRQALDQLTAPDQADSMPAA